MLLCKSFSLFLHFFTCSFFDAFVRLLILSVVSFCACPILSRLSECWVQFYLWATVVTIIAPKPRHRLHTCTLVLTFKLPTSLQQSSPAGIAPEIKVGCGRLSGKHTATRHIRHRTVPPSDVRSLPLARGRRHRWVRSIVAWRDVPVTHRENSAIAPRQKVLGERGVNRGREGGYPPCGISHLPFQVLRVDFPRRQVRYTR